MEICTWVFTDWTDTDKLGYASEWNLKTDCGEHIHMTRANRYGKLFDRYCEPELQSNPKDLKCAICGDNIRFYNPFED